MCSEVVPAVVWGTTWQGPCLISTVDGSAWGLVPSMPYLSGLCTLKHLYMFSWHSPGCAAVATLNWKINKPDLKSNLQGSVGTWGQITTLWGHRYRVPLNLAIREWSPDLVHLGCRCCRCLSTSVLLAIEVGCTYSKIHSEQNEAIQLWAWIRKTKACLSKQLLVIAQKKPI